MVIETIYRKSVSLMVDYMRKKTLQNLSPITSFAFKITDQIIMFLISIFIQKQSR